MLHFVLSLHFPNEPIRMNTTIVELFKHNYMSTVSTRWVWVRQLKHFPACPTVTTTLTLSHLNSWYKADVEVGTMIHSYSHVSQLLIRLFSTVTGPLKEKQIAFVCRETLQVRLFSPGSLLLLHCKVFTDTLLTQWVMCFFPTSEQLQSCQTTKCIVDVLKLPLQ